MTSQLDDEQPLSVINAISVSAPLTEGLNAQRNRGARARWCGRVNTTTPNAYPNVIQPSLRSTLSFPLPRGQEKTEPAGPNPCTREAHRRSYADWHGAAAKWPAGSSNRCSAQHTCPRRFAERRAGEAAKVPDRSRRESFRSFRRLSERPPFE